MARKQISIKPRGVLVLMVAMLIGRSSLDETAAQLSLDRPALKIERESDQVLKVSFPSVAVQKYQLAFSSDFRRWDVLGDWVDGTGAVVSLRVPKPAESTGFFKVSSTAGPVEESDQKKLVGVWRGGWPYEKTPTYEIVITPEKITGKNLKDESSLGEGTYKLDPVKKTIDATMTVNPGKGTTYLGLYALDGDTLQWCSNNGTKKRPLDLADKPSADQYLLVLKRQN